MFNKKESQDADVGSNRARSFDTEASSSGRSAAPAPPAGRAGGVATIGPSIRIDGDLHGDEDLIVEGQVKGTVQLKANTLTIGSQGKVEARVYAHTILVDGTVHGDLFASERISIRKSARIEGNILAPRISLEDGARFRGAIDMDAESEAFRKAFGTSAGTERGATRGGEARTTGGSAPQDSDKNKPKATGNDSGSGQGSGDKASPKVSGSVA